MKKSFLAHLRSLVFSPLAALLVLAAVVSTHAATSLDFTIEAYSGDYYSGTERSLGSGVTYWPNRNSYLVLDNTVPSGSHPRLVEYFRNHTIDREILLVGFRDPEDIHWLYGNTFVIAQEKHTLSGPDSVDDLVIITLPGTGDADTSVSVTDFGVRVLTISTDTQNGGFLSDADGGDYNKGIEAVAYLGGNLYFTTEWAPDSPANFWKVWTVPENSSSGTIVPTVAFDLASILPGGVSDISGMATDGAALWLLSEQGAGERILKVSTSGTLLADYTLPEPIGFNWDQPEAIELFLDPADRTLKILITGEVGGGGGVDFMLLKAPRVRLATTGATYSDGWGSYPFAGAGHSQNVVSTASSINTSGLLDPAPQAVYKRLAAEPGTLTWTAGGLSPSATYKVRVHLSSIEFTGYSNVRETLTVTDANNTYSIANITPYLSGGFNQAMIVQFSQNFTPNASGQISGSMIPTGGYYFYAAVSGVEVVKNP